MSGPDTLPSELAIRVEALGKRYGTSRRRRKVPKFIEDRRQRLDATIGDAVDEDDLDADETEDDDEIEAPEAEQWVLRNVSFDVPRGSGVALVGESGSGKTTLIRVLARITPPSEGRAAVRGRTIPLVEVAANLLQPEQSVRSNIIGLARLFGVPAPVARRHVEDVAAFAEVHDRLDVVARRLSSGLLRRVTIATALCLEADVILADELLTKGEHAFAERAIERLASERARGATLVVATHDLALARRICDSALYLRQGEPVEFGALDQVLETYRHDVSGSSKTRAHDNDVAIEAATVLRGTAAVDEHRAGDDLVVAIELTVAGPDVVVHPFVTFASEGQVLFRIAHPSGFTVDESGAYLVTASVDVDEVASVLQAGAEVEAQVRCTATREGTRLSTTVRRRFDFAVVPGRQFEDADSGPREPGVDELGIADETARGHLVDVTEADWRVERI